MKREFQIVYQEQSRLTIGEAAADASVAKLLKGAQTPEFFPHGPLQTLNVIATLEKDARKMVPGVHIVSTTLIKILIDPAQQWFRVEEAAEYLRCSNSQIYELMDEGKLPKAKDGNPIFSRRQLDAVAQDNMTKIDFPKGLKQAA